MEVKIGQVYKRPQDTTWKMVFMVSGSYVATMSLTKTNKFWDKIDMSLGEFGWPNPTKVENSHMDSIGELMGTVSIRDYRKVMNVIHDFTMGRIRYVPRIGYMYIDEIEDIILEVKEIRGEATPTKREPDVSNVHKSNFPTPKKINPPVQTQVDNERPEEAVEEPIMKDEEEVDEEAVEDIVVESEEDKLEREKRAIAMNPVIDLVGYFNKFILKKDRSSDKLTTSTSSKPKKKVGRKPKYESIKDRGFNHDEIISIASMSTNAIAKTYDISQTYAANIRSAALDILGMRDKDKEKINWMVIFDNCNSYNMEQEIEALAKEYQTTVNFVRRNYKYYLNNRKGLLTFSQFYPEFKKTIKNFSMKDIASIESSVSEDISKIYGISIDAANRVKVALKDDYLNKDPLFVVFGSIVYDNDAFADYIGSMRSSNANNSRAIIEVYERILKVRKQYIATYHDHAAIIAEKKKAPNFYTKQEHDDFIMLLKHRFNMHISVTHLNDDEKIEIINTKSSSTIARKYLITPNSAHCLKSTIKSSLNRRAQRSGDVNTEVLVSAT